MLLNAREGRGGALEDLFYLLDLWGLIAYIHRVGEGAVFGSFVHSARAL